MVIQKHCCRMISARPTAQTAVQAAMNADVAGQEMLHKYTVEQISTVWSMSNDKQEPD